MFDPVTEAKALAARAEEALAATEARLKSIEAWIGPHMLLSLLMAAAVGFLLGKVI